MIIQEIWVERQDGSKEKVDTAENESEAIQLASEYRAVNKDVWLQLGNLNEEENK